MDSWISINRLKKYVAAFTVMVVVVWIINEWLGTCTTFWSKEHSVFRDWIRKRHMHCIIRSSKDYSVGYLRMDVRPFMHLALIMHDKYLLCGTKHVSIEEQLAIFLHIIGFNIKNRTMWVEFLRSGETTNRYFNDVLHVVCRIRDDFAQPP